MMKIGDFSQLTGIPIKTLRYYSEIGLLNPTYVDNNNYRYFGLEQILEINRIIELKESGFTLNEISKTNLKEMSESDILRMYQTKLITAEKERQFIDMKIANLKEKISEMIEKENSKMILNNLQQSPNHSTLMGMIKGVVDFYSINLNPEILYGLTGHAFMINIHDELCPSGPYCYDLTIFKKLLSNLGIDMKDNGFFHQDSSLTERKQIEDTIKKHLDSNNPCGLLNLEFQIIYGYDNSGLLTSQPWSSNFPPGHLTYNTWKELGDNVFMSIFTFSKVSKKPIIDMIKASLHTVIEMNTNPEKYTKAPYHTGLKAYDVFIKAVEDGHGNGQGNRWNATVWGECRNMAASFFEELSKMYPNLSTEFLSLSYDYKLIGESLTKISESNLSIEPRIKVLEEIKETERLAIEKIRNVLDKL